MITTHSISWLPMQLTNCWLLIPWWQLLCRCRRGRCFVHLQFVLVANIRAFDDKLFLGSIWHWHLFSLCLHQCKHLLLVEVPSQLTFLHLLVYGRNVLVSPNSSVQLPLLPTGWFSDGVTMDVSWRKEKLNMKQLQLFLYQIDMLGKIYIHYFRKFVL